MIERGCCFCFLDKADLTDGDEGDQHAGHQQLVRRGVEERPERGGLLPSARQPAIKVGCRSDREQDGGDDVRVLHPVADERRRHHDPRQRHAEVRDARQESSGSLIPGVLTTSQAS